MILRIRPTPSGRVHKTMRQRRCAGVTLGKINPIKMPAEISAMRLATLQRDAWLDRKAERYQERCPPFSCEALLANLPRLRLYTQGQREASKILKELLNTHNPTTVNYTITDSRATFRIGLRALRLSGDHDSVISWIVGHFLSHKINRLELTVYGLATLVRKKIVSIIAVLAACAVALYVLQDEVKKMPDVAAKAVEEAVEVAQSAAATAGLIEAPARTVQRNGRRGASFPLSKDYTEGEVAFGATMGYAIPTAMATLVFGLPGAVWSAYCSTAVFLLYSIEEKE